MTNNTQLGITRVAAAVLIFIAAVTIVLWLTSAVGKGVYIVVVALMIALIVPSAAQFAKKFREGWRSRS